MEAAALLQHVRKRLAQHYGPRLRGVVLYGSEARRQARADSDIDVLVLLEGPVDYWAEVKAVVTALYPLVLEWDRPIHAKPVDVADYEAQAMPLYRNAHREGVAV